MRVEVEYEVQDTEYNADQQWNIRSCQCTESDAGSDGTVYAASGDQGATSRISSGIMYIANPSVSEGI